MSWHAARKEIIQRTGQGGIHAEGVAAEDLASGIEHMDAGETQ